MSRLTKPTFHLQVLIVACGICISAIALLTVFYQPSYVSSNEMIVLASDQSVDDDDLKREPAIPGSEEHLTGQNTTAKTPQVHYNFLTSFFVAESKTKKNEAEEDGDHSKGLLSRLASVYRLF